MIIATALRHDSGTTNDGGAAGAGKEGIAFGATITATSAGALPFDVCACDQGEYDMRIRLFLKLFSFMTTTICSMFFTLLQVSGGALLVFLQH